MKYSDELRVKKKHKRKLRISIFVCALVIIFLGLIVVLFFANLFDVRTVDIQSPSSISPELVEAKMNEILDQSFFGIKRRSNIILFSPERFRATLIREFPRINTIEIRRRSLHEIHVSIQDRKPAGIWCAPNCFYFDEQGIAFAEVASSSGFLFIAVEDHRGHTIELGKSVVSEDWRNSIFEVRRLFQFANITVAKIIVPQDSLGEFTVMVSEGWKIYFSNQTNVSQQTTNFMIFLKEKLTPAVRLNLDYVDLRIPDRIYYKSKE